MLGDELRRERRAAGLTQQALAEATHLHRNYISLVERNGQMPSVKTFVDICAALGVSAAQVLGRVEKALAKAPRNRKGKQPSRRYKTA
jgi:transcriptional regulator with XRE-family HTH domain